MGKHILLAVTGSISAYKSADIANELTKKRLYSRCPDVKKQSGIYYAADLTVFNKTQSTY